MQINLLLCWFLSDFQKQLCLWHSAVKAIILPYSTIMTEHMHRNVNLQPSSRQTQLVCHLFQQQQQRQQLWPCCGERRVKKNAHSYLSDDFALFKASLCNWHFCIAFLDSLNGGPVQSNPYVIYKKNNVTFTRKKNSSWADLEMLSYWKKVFFVLFHWQGGG